jgi:membrane protein
MEFFHRTGRKLSGKLRVFRYRLVEYTAVRFAIAMAQRLGRDDVSNRAASISYYALLSLFPLLLGLIAILGLFLPSESVRTEMIRFITQYLPGSADFLEENISGIISLRGAFGIISVLGLFWSASGVFSVISQAINRAWDIEYRHPFYIQKPREIALALGTGFLVLLSIGVSTFLSFLGRIDLPLSGALVNTAAVFAAFIVSLIAFTILYRSVPITWISWKYVMIGALLATLLFEIAKNIFVLYLNNYSNFDKVYGSIASVIALLVWVYISAFILILGAEFSAMVSRLQKKGNLLEQEGEK